MVALHERKSLRRRQLIPGYSPRYRHPGAIALITHQPLGLDPSGEPNICRQQGDKAQRSLDASFAPSEGDDEVLFHLPVTKSWLYQLILGLVLICLSSYRGAVELLRDFFDTLSASALSTIVSKRLVFTGILNQNLAAIAIAARFWFSLKVGVSDPRKLWMAALLRRLNSNS